MTFDNELYNSFIVSGAFVLIFIFAELLRKYTKTEVEKTRKFVHLASGGVCLSFSYLFQSHWIVLILTSIFLGIILVSKRLGLLQSIHGVERKSSGGAYYPVAIYLTFLIAQNNQKPEYYFISILVLAVSDTLAAIIGKKYGQKEYRVGEGIKSLEGSFTFFAVTFNIVLVSLLLLTGIPRLESIMLSFYIALLITSFESISLKGADNFFIPIGAIAILLKSDSLNAIEIGKYISVLVGLFIFVFLISRKSNRMGLTAMIGISLIMFGAYSLIEPLWAIPILICMFIFSYIDIFLEPKEAIEKKYGIRPTFFFLLISFLWILIANLSGYDYHLFFVSFVTNLTANLGILWQRKSIIFKDDYITLLPDWIINANKLTRAILLNITIITIPALISKEISLVFSLIAGIIGTIAIETIYWRIASVKRKSWDDITYLQMGSIVSFFVTSIILALSVYFYYVLIHLPTFENLL